MIRRLKTAKPEGERAEEDAKVRATVEAALADIARRGDAAVREMSQKFDGHSPETFRLTDGEIQTALSSVAKRDLEDIRFAQEQVRNLQRSSARHCATSKSRRGLGSCSDTRTFRSIPSAVTCPAASILWWPRRI